MEEIKAKVKELEKAKHELADLIIDEVAKVCAEQNLDEATFIHRNIYKRDGKEVSCDPVDVLYEQYCTHVYPSGFIGAWQKESGWAGG